MSSLNLSNCFASILHSVSSDIWHSISRVSSHKYLRMTYRGISIFSRNFSYVIAFVGCNPAIFTCRTVQLWHNSNQLSVLYLWCHSPFADVCAKQHRVSLTKDLSGNFAGVYAIHSAVFFNSYFCDPRTGTGLSFVL